MKKLLVRIVLVLVALVVVLFLARNFIARKSVEIGTKQLTGFPLDIGSVNLGVFGGVLEVQNLKLMNPPEFKGGTFVDLPLFKVDYYTMSMLSGSPHLKEVNVNLEQVVVVKNEKGETNANVIQERISPAEESESAETKPAPKEEKKQAYRVDLVKVHIGTVIIQDYSKGGKLSEKKMTLNRDIELENVTESTSISALVMKAALGPVADVAGGLVKDVGALTDAAGKAVSGTVGNVEKAGKGLFDSFKKAIPQK